MQPKIVKEQDIDAKLDEAIRRSLCICFPDDREIFEKTRAWHGSVPAWSVLIEHEGLVVAHVAVIDRTILVGDQALRVAGVGNVFTLPEYRGKGLYFKVMKTAMAGARDQGLDCGLLFCAPRIEKVYAFIGWRTLHDVQVVRIDESGREAPIPDKNITMFLPLNRSEFPPGRVHLQGNDW